MVPGKARNILSTDYHNYYDRDCGQGFIVILIMNIQIINSMILAKIMPMVLAMVLFTFYSILIDYFSFSPLQETNLAAAQRSLFTDWKINCFLHLYSDSMTTLIQCHISKGVEWLDIQEEAFAEILL